MSYMVMLRGAMHLRTNDRAQVRAKLLELGDTAYIKYSQQAIAQYEAGHDPHRGEKEHRPHIKIQAS